MNANDFRKLFDYHFTRNRQLWEHSICKLTAAQFLQDLPYSIGSIRNQTVHMMSIDQRWIWGLRHLDIPDFLDPHDFPDRAAVRAVWDEIEDGMMDYLNTLNDRTLNTCFVDEYAVWEVLYHILNHGTDHRAQVLAMLNQLGAPTFPQDYFYFARGIDVLVAS